ncbi:hypothetical protein PoB_005971000 [Plakobranchus ocellatus]|uniref:Uncharacterized protein n=1 Tax=Plakobranchus ocellatus TaxID=259542 RepID=A0AAV4CJY3_9GAST|nr:hypothetical protein PoB_005971000 [Plakobranchus ocellatus]
MQRRGQGGSSREETQSIPAYGHFAWTPEGGTGEVVAHLVGHLATRSEVRGSNPNPGLINFFIAPGCPPSTIWGTETSLTTGAIQHVNQHNTDINTGNRNISDNMGYTCNLTQGSEASPTGAIVRKLQNNISLPCLKQSNGTLNTGPEFFITSIKLTHHTVKGCTFACQITHSRISSSNGLEQTILHCLQTLKDMLKFNNSDKILFPETGNETNIDTKK